MGSLPARPLASVALALVLTLSGCGKIRSLAGGDGEKGSTGSGASASAQLAFLKGFEGEIGLLVKDSTKAGKPIPPLALMIKDARVRLELPQELATQAPMGAKGYVVLNAPEKKVHIVLDDKKQVVLFEFDKVGEQFKAFGAGGAETQARDATPRKPPKVTKTGKKETVAGYTCEIWDVVPDTGEKGSVCVADEGASWFHLPITGIPTEHAWALELFDGKHFPLRGVFYDNAGVEKTRIEVTKIDKKALAAALFEIPAGYTVVDLQQMMMGAMQLGRMPGPGGLPAGLPPGMIPPGMMGPRPGAPRIPPPPAKKP